MTERARVVYGITAGVSADKLLRGQLAWLREQGWEVHLAVNPDDSASRAAAREGVTLEPTPMSREISLAQDLRSLGAWLRLLRRLRPSAVNVSTPKAGLLGGIAAVITGVPRRVYVLRGLRVEGSSGPMARLLWAMEAITMACATDVVVVSESLGAEARRRRLLRGRAWLVGQGSSNGVLAAQVMDRVKAANPAALRSELGTASTDIVVGYVGRIVRDKGVGVLLEAIAGIPPETPLKVLLIGSVNDPELQDELDSLGSRIVHIDWTDDVWSYYSVMDVLCLPTRREGYPNVILEAASAEVPAITTTATGAVDSVLDGKTGLLVPVDDPDALRSALRRLVEDPELRTGMGRAARERVEREYDPTTIWSGIQSILRGTPAPNVRAL